jgi:predicted negative regulator of RcsB-dependent stress response
MEMYQTEEQQLEAIKRWWKGNGASAIAGIALGALLIVGYNLWQDHRAGQAEQAAGQYQQIVKAMESQQAESAIKLSERLIADDGGSVYGLFARLALAKLKAETGDLAAAKAQLEAALGQAKDDKFKHLARLRLAQVLLDSGDANAALAQLEQAKDTGAFERDYALLKGDAYSALGRQDQAKTAYQTAQRLGAASAMLQMKLEELGASLEPAH